MDHASSRWRCFSEVPCLSWGDLTLSHNVDWKPHSGAVHATQAFCGLVESLCTPFSLSNQLHCLGPNHPESRSGANWVPHTATVIFIYDGRILCVARFYFGNLRWFIYKGWRWAAVGWSSLHFTSLTFCQLSFWQRLWKPDPPRPLESIFCSALLHISHVSFHSSTMCQCLKNCSYGGGIKVPLQSAHTPLMNLS